ncbi:MAG: hypothetical protein EZS26_000752 [Candidatus Ordinivivax streblomastigis]|uniref:Uncharacterized protein n=1 Tax=Candidatus Ordinivivax streblomastigis TaxID=2540710 RepID=A0A5M8P3U1_9BACT|nr:MAG: hypothetical protein EZS26_000752 [Candidatus Ordinivivax streblomastigis]
MASGSEGGAKGTKLRSSTAESNRAPVWNNSMDTPF